MTKEEGVTTMERSRKFGSRKKNPIKMASDTAIKALMTKGFSVRKAAEFMGVSPTTVMRVRNDMKALQPAEDLKSSFLSPSRDEKLGKLVDHFLDKGTRLRQVKGSDALGAAKLYADRRYPVRQEQAPSSFSFANVNLNLFLPDPQPAPQEIVEPGPDNEPPEGTL